uniref:CHAT domain-containing protein n=1 Tax=Herbidospora sakaeratensis TaxID=564415 RepID=UPI0007804D3C|nr:CHAT domain-containing protein [Herbidospora sakaeratensis]
MQYDYHDEFPLRRTPAEPAGSDRLRVWAAIADVRLQRAYLHEHPRIADAAEPTGGDHRDAALLRTVRALGGSAAAIDHAYADVYGGLATTTAPWLTDLENTLAGLLDARHRLNRSPRRVEVLQAGLARLGPADDPAVEAALLRELAVAVAENTRIRRLDAFERAIELAGQAATIFERRGLRRQLAITRTILGGLYLDRITGLLPDNHRIAAGLVEAAQRVLTPELHPVEHAETQVGLALIHQYQRVGERRANQEQAIAWYQDALRVFTETGFPHARARTLTLLSSAYWQRVMGRRAHNMEHAIRCLHQAARIWPGDLYPVQNARVQHNLALMHLEREAGGRSENIERALGHAQQALNEFTREDFPVQHGQGLLNLAAMYNERHEGDRGENVEHALSALTRALSVRTLEDFPSEYAVTQAALADTHQRRAGADPRDNTRRAIACYREALRVWTREASPHDHRENLLKLAKLLADLGDWPDAHQAYAEAIETERLLVALGTGVPGQETVFAAGGDAHVRAAYALTRTGDLGAAADMVEGGRARILAEALRLDQADPSRIPDATLRAGYAAARDRLIDAQREMTVPVAGSAAEIARMLGYRSAKAAFDQAVAAVRERTDLPDFFAAGAESETIAGATAALGPAAVLVYLLATPWGGCAIAARAPGPAFALLDLPALTDDLLADLTSGLLVVHSGECLQRLTRLGRTLRDSAAALPSSPLTQAVRAALSRPLFGALADRPLGDMDETEQGIAEETIGEALVQAELRRVEPALGSAVMAPLVSWLRSLGAAEAAVVPSGRLGMLPLASVRVTGAATAAEHVLITIVPGAKVLARPAPAARREGVVVLGDPTDDLPWSAAETSMVARAAAKAGLAVDTSVGQGVTRERLVSALSSGLIVSTSCHGVFDRFDGLRSALCLAGGELVTIGDVLGRVADLRGLRLLILSACQTAVLDPDRAPEEMRTMAAAMVQAGARAVVASLWPVDDRATFLLMTRFAAEWFDRLDTEAPAAAFSRAQRWVREATHDQIGAWLRHSAAGVPSVPGAGGLAALRGRSRALGAAPAHRVGDTLDALDGPGARPYAAPYYWAGFQIIGR